jgi:hypothetical protein
VSHHKRIVDLACIDRSRKSVHDASAAIINAEMTLLDGCRIMISSNCKEAFILHKNNIIGMVTRDDLFKAAFLDIETFHEALQDAQKTNDRTVELQLSLHNEIRSHLNTIHTGIAALQTIPEDLAMVHGIALSASAIGETLQTFEKALAADWPGAAPAPVAPI